MLFWQRAFSCRLRIVPMNGPMHDTYGHIALTVANAVRTRMSNKYLEQNICAYRNGINILTKVSFCFHLSFWSLNESDFIAM